MGFQALLDEGDEVLTMEPAMDIYAAQARPRCPPPSSADPRS